MIQPIKLCARCGHGFIPLGREDLYCKTCEVALVALALHDMAVSRARVRCLAFAGLTLIGVILWLLFR